MAIGSRTLLKAVTRMVAAASGMSEPRILGFDSEKHVSLARKRACWAAHRILHVSLSRIAEYYGDRDHTTVLYLIRSYDSLVLADQVERSKSSVLRKELRLWHAAKRKDPTCQTDAACARLRGAVLLTTVKRSQRGELSDVAWYERDGERTTPVSDLREQNERFLAAMKAGLAAEKADAEKDDLPKLPAPVHGSG